MKIRLGFVSNSSSSSFAISLRHLNIDQLCKIMNHTEWGKKLGVEYSDDAWSIEVRNGILYADTSMDNFDFGEFMEKIGVNPDAIKWGERGGYDDEGTTDEQPEPCDPKCDACQMRFYCYTNRPKKNWWEE